MTQNRRIAFLMLFSALVAPAQAMAAGCGSDSLDIDRALGVDLSKSVMKNVFVAGAVAAGVFLAVPAVTAAGAIGIFAGLTMLMGAGPPIRRARDQTFSALDNAFTIQID